VQGEGISFTLHFLFVFLPGSAQTIPFLRMKLEKEAAIPGQPIELTVTLFVSTWLPKLPWFLSFETPNAIVCLPLCSSNPVSEQISRATRPGGAHLALACWGGVRFWPPIFAWLRHPREAYLAFEAYALALALKAVRSRDLGDALRAVELWSSRLPTESDDQHALRSIALAEIDALSRGQAEISGASDRKWSDVRYELNLSRRARLRLQTMFSVSDALPPLNPQENA
jgi:hypothetical protein